MISSALLLSGAALVSFESGIRQSSAELQEQIDQIVERCGSDRNLRAKALTPTSIGVDFVKPPSDVWKDKTLSWVLSQLRALKGVSVAVVGSEQYLDQKGNRH